MMVDGVASPPLLSKTSWLSSFTVNRLVYMGMIQALLYQRRITHSVQDQSLKILHLP